MLVSSLLEAVLPLQGWRAQIAPLDREGRQLEIHLEPRSQRASCSICGAVRRRYHDMRGGERRWRERDLFGWRVTIVARLRRVDCRRCGVRTEGVPWARPGARMTRALELAVAGLARDASLLAVARHFRLGWKAVFAVVKRLVTEALRRKRRRLRRIGVDEIAFGRGHKYLTIVFDHDAGEVVWVGEDRQAETLERFYRELGPRRAGQIECVTMDMWRAFIAATRQYAPQAIILFDRFHVERHLNDAVNDVRKQEFFRQGGHRRELMRGKKWLLLRRRSRVRGKDRRTLDALLALNRRLTKAYLMKEQFARLWTYRTLWGARRFLESWADDLRWSRLKPLQRFLRLVRKHEQGILAHALFPIGNAAVEGNNSRIRGLSHRARGFRNKANLILAIFHVCGRLTLA